MKSFLRDFLVWRIKHVNNKTFGMILSGVIGGLAGLAAVVLKLSVHGMEHLIFELKFDFFKYFYPLLGIILTIVISRYFFREKLGHGVSDILYAISRKSSKMKTNRMYSRMLTSAFTVGFGGSVGLEAPIVVTGSAIGSNIGRFMHMNYKQRTIFIGCGAAGAIAGIFNSPIAGVIFASEVILAGIGFSSFIPLLIAAVCGSLVTLSLPGADILFTFHLQDSFNAQDAPYYILLGILCGLMSVYFTRTTYFVEKNISKIKNFNIRGIAGGLILALSVLFLPPIYGEGYGFIKTLLTGNLDQVLTYRMAGYELSNPLNLWVFLVGLMVIKPLASSVTIAAGGSGGIFGPSLFLGGISGFTMANFINTSYGERLVSLSNFTLVGMCGVMSGVLHAPLTAIFLIAEITGGYTLFVPLMIVSAISYITSSYFENYSIYTKNLIERGEYIPHDKDKQLLSQISLNAIIEKDLHKISPDKTLGDLVKIVKKSKRNVFPVVDNKGKLKGIITLDDIRELMFDEESRNELIVDSIMHAPPGYISSNEGMQAVMNKFEKTGAWNLPVIDNDVYVGFVSKSRVFNTYRTKLKQDKVE